MGRFIRITACVCLCQLLFGYEGAVALESNFLVDQIRERGVAEFVRYIFDNSQPLRYSLAKQRQAEMLEGVAKHTRGRLKDVRASKVYSMPGLDFTIIEIVDEGTTNMMMVTSASERSDSVYDLSFFSLEDGNMVENFSSTNDLLENVQLDSKVIELTLIALKEMFRNKDSKYLDDYEIALANKALGLPTYVKKRLSEKTEESRNRLNSALNLLGYDGEVKYLGTKNIIGQHRISLFGVPSAWGPLVFGVHFVVLETGPVVCKASLVVGSTSMPYINDYRKVFSITGNSLTQGGIK